MILENEPIMSGLFFMVRDIDISQINNFINLNGIDLNRSHSHSLSYPKRSINLYNSGLIMKCVWMYPHIQAT